MRLTPHTIRRTLSLAVMLTGGIGLAQMLPTGLNLTPTAAPGAVFQQLNPGVSSQPDYTVGQAVATALSPDGTTLLILTSGYNLMNDANGNGFAPASSEWVFVYNTRTNPATQVQAIPVPNTFNGIAWNPNGTEFYVSGGVNDSVHIYRLANGFFSESAPAVALGHKAGLGLAIRPEAAGLDVSPDGTMLLVANFENDSVSLVNLAKRQVVSELDLRPGVEDASQAGTPGGSFPFAVVFQSAGKAYVSSPRDREIDVLSIPGGGGAPAVTSRIRLDGQPTKMVVDGAKQFLYAALDNTDTVAIIDTSSDTLVNEIGTIAPASVFANSAGLRGASPNGLAISADQKTLYVTNGGANSLAVVTLTPGNPKGATLAGLIPTGWYPNAVAVSAKGDRLFVVNGKSIPGPNMRGCRNTAATTPGAERACSAANQYIWQLTKAGLLMLPTPTPAQLSTLTAQVAANNNYNSTGETAANQAVMAALHAKIKHIIYIVKENRTYDQVLGDLGKGNGDPYLAILGNWLTPNLHQIASNFVDLDNFYDSAETSGDGWNWSTAARTTDSTEKTEPVNYSGRGLSYDYEGTNRNINVGFATPAQRQAADPLTPSDANLLAGQADISEHDGPNGQQGAGYLWDAALRAGLTVRNYGFFLDLTRYSVPVSLGGIPPLENPYSTGTVVAYPTKAALQPITDPYFRGFDNNLPDYFRFVEWKREFDQFDQNGGLPALSLVRLMHDHFGSFSTAIDGVNTVETEAADNDYAVGLLLDRVAHSSYAANTLVFVLEDDAQDGADHVDAHRSIGFIAGPYVKQGAVVSTNYNTVNMLRTMEDILGLSPLGLNDGLAQPMGDVFNASASPWTYEAIVPPVLWSTGLAPYLNPAGVSAAVRNGSVRPLHDAAYWARETAGMDFSVEDHLDTARFNRALWRGMKGADAAYPGPDAVNPASR